MGLRLASISRLARCTAGRSYQSVAGEFVGRKFEFSSVPVFAYELSTFGPHPIRHNFSSRRTDRSPKRTEDIGYNRAERVVCLDDTDISRVERNHLGQTQLAVLQGKQNARGHHLNFVPSSSREAGSFFGQLLLAPVPAVSANVPGASKRTFHSSQVSGTSRPHFRGQIQGVFGNDVEVSRFGSVGLAKTSVSVFVGPVDEARSQPELACGS